MSINRDRYAKQGFPADLDAKFHRAWLDMKCGGDGCSSAERGFMDTIRGNIVLREDGKVKAPFSAVDDTIRNQKWWAGRRAALLALA